MPPKRQSIQIHGDVEDGYGPVADEFRRNFTHRGELGAAVAAYQGGKPVVDLWAGSRDRKTRAPWERDTTVVIFSSTKGMAGLALAAAVSAGVLDYDATVASYWPEFAEHGKESITVRQLIDHQCGLHIIDGHKLRMSDLSDTALLERVLAGQGPAWEPGSRQGYHGVSIGPYQNALFRRVDPQGRSIGRFLRDEFAEPLGVDLSIGLPGDRDIDEVAELCMASSPRALRYQTSIPWALLAQQVTRRGSFYASVANPPIGDPWKLRRREVLDHELPSANGVSNARALARIYGAAAAGTGELPISSEVLAQITGDAPDPADDAVLRIPTRYHLGLRRSSPRLRFGSADNRAFGTPGLGGSLGFGDPASGIGFGYTMNRLGLALEDDIRAKTLEAALFDVVGR